MTQQTYKTARRRFKRAYFSAMAMYVVAILGGTYFLKSLEVEPVWLQISIALAVALPLCVSLGTMLRHFNETDEYNRMMHFRSFAYGGALTVSLVFVIGSLQMFDVIESFEIFWIGVFFFFAYGISHRLLGGRDCA